MEPSERASDQPISRRHAMKLGAVGLGGAAVSMAFITNASGITSAIPTVMGAAPQPPVQIIKSSGGLLQGSLVIAPTDAWIAGDTASGFWTYNGSYPGPVLWAKPGDRVVIDVTNNLNEMTNTHFHGFHVTPKDAGDNVFAMINPGETFHHDFVIPANHPGGLYWYHPHVHGLTDTQIYNGMAGLFVIEGGAMALPALADKAHVLMALKNVAYSNPPGRALLPEPSAANQVQTLNGDLAPALSIAPGETQLWQMCNMGNDGYLNIQLEGHTFTVVAEDGHLLWQTYDTNSLVMPPGKRFEVAVTGGPAGTYSFNQLGYTQGPFGIWPSQVLGTLTSAGADQTPAVIPSNPAPRVDLKNEPIANHRVMVMSESFPPSEPLGGFLMNGVLFQNITPNQVIQVTLGDVEEWAIVNDPSIASGGAPEQHPFHLHINHMVLQGTGTWNNKTAEPSSYTAIDSPGAVDTVNVKPGEFALVRIKFEDFTGLTVFHCHITYHEDHGMMGEINMNAAVVPEPVVPVPATPTFTG